ncbi:DUF4365 domain-containing protein [Pseudomonas fluorescens]|uniref:Photosystem I assembly protein Ycf3 n=1 Tax=Pseudomonas fluorescens TaxID=294 RepID=A0A5E6XQE0_PSEFL|nr:DUF4365 domain-containing protein [Pseudomonas fluorescens]VVN43186.1 Photosystem I assembly protein Ycf3 [Pseudomonas fluorescens]
MDHFNNLPTRHKNHVTESKAEAAFQSFLSSSEYFVLQTQDRKDYGTDCQIEVIDHESATNVRIHVQLKGTEGSVNSDGSISVEIRRSNLNYLLMHAHSLFVCYHVPTATLRFCSADNVVRRYEHSGQNWTRQQTLTVKFSEVLTELHLKLFAALAKAGALSLRDTRIRQAIARPEDVPGILKKSRPDLHVPDDENQAAIILSSLYDSGEDEIISAAFDRFLSVLSIDNDAIIFCYMAEINLGMAKLNKNSARLTDGIFYLSSKISEGRIDVGSLHYSIGNALSALGREGEAVDQYQTALDHIVDDAGFSLFAQCYKNLGTSYEKLGYEEKAAGFYREALRHNPQLPEAHYALGLYCLRSGEYGEALEHFDSVVFAENALGKRSSVSGWRINALFNLSDGRAAFREINSLLSDAGYESWIWPWCSQQVASFGRCSLENAKLSILFWDRYLIANPNCSRGVRERLMSKFYLHSEDPTSDITYLVFKREFEGAICHVDGEPLAYLWDRLGHLAQEEDNWEEAERCYRVAYNLEGGHYGYCLGTALNFLNRPKESLPILLLQAEEVQRDEMSWFQVAVAYEKLKSVRESISAYTKAIALNPDYELAWFNMGGVYWNAGEREEASRVWKIAANKFPSHALVAVLRRELPFTLM